MEFTPWCSSLLPDCLQIGHNGRLFLVMLVLVVVLSSTVAMMLVVIVVMVMLVIVVAVSLVSVSERRTNQRVDDLRRKSADARLL